MNGFFYETVGSTNDVGVWLIEHGISQPFFVTAQRQTNGRGQFNRVWYSGDRENLYISFVFCPNVMPDAFQNFSINVAERLVQKLSQELKIDLRIKFPNDIYCGDCKLCGILTESKIVEDRIRFAVTGIGLNISGDLSAFPQNIKNMATTLSACSNLYVSKKQVRGWVIEVMTKLIREISDKSCQTR